MKRVLWVGLLLLFALLLVSCDAREEKGAPCILGIHDFGQREDYDAEKNATLLCEKRIYVRSCSLCGEKKYERGTANDHRIVEEYDAPTCIEKGGKRVYCERCVLREESVYDALGHDLSSTVFHNKTHHWRVCNRCTMQTDLDHHFFEVDGNCQNCDAVLTTDGVIYELSADGSYAVVSQYLGFDSDVVIRKEYEGVPVLEIRPYAFMNLGITSVTIPDSVESIGSMAFASCTQLSRVVMGRGVLQIGDRAFYGCTALWEVAFSESLRRIGGEAFSVCTKLSYLFLPDGLEQIDIGAFQSCTGLIGAILPDSVIALGSRAFENCSALTTVTLGNGLEVVREMTFSGCEQLQNVTIGSSLRAVESNAFSDCFNLRFIHYVGEILPSFTIEDGNEEFSKAMIVIPT